jgi:hypothetical protein
MAKLTDNISTKSGRGSQNYSIPSTSSASRSRGNSQHWVKGSINPMPTHLHHLHPPHNHIPPSPLPFNNISYPQPPPPHNQFFQLPPPPPPQFGTTDPKSPLANHLQLARWPKTYRATSLPKYHENTDPHKFLMCYEADIAWGDEVTLANNERASRPNGPPCGPPTCTATDIAENVDI